MNKVQLKELKECMPDFSEKLREEHDKVLNYYKARIKPYTDTVYQRLPDMLLAVRELDETLDIDIFNTKRLGTNYRLRLIKSEKQRAEEIKQVEKEVETMYTEKISILQEEWVDTMLAKDVEEKAEQTALEEKQKYEKLKHDLLKQL